MAIPALLEELLRAPGPPGAEDAVTAIVRREAEGLGLEVERDVLGSTIARLPGSARAGRTLALVAHVDQVALSVARHDEDGRLRVSPLGQWSAGAAVGRRVRILTASGEVPGVAVKAGDDAEPSWEAIRIDVGASDADEARGLVAAGDPAVLAGEPLELAGGRVASAALDDRLGVYAALETLRRLVAEPPPWDVALVATVQEETPETGGAAVAAARLRPDVAVVVECTYASDAPSGPAPWGEAPLGGGPVVFRGPVVHPAVAAGLFDAARAAGAPVGVESGSSTWSDADVLFAAAEGIATGLLSIPIRHMHTTGEIGQLSDVDATVAVLVRYASALAPDASFAR